MSEEIDDDKLTPREAKILRIAGIIGGVFVAIFLINIITPTAKISIHLDTNEILSSPYVWNGSYWNFSGDKVPFRIVGYPRIESIDIAKEYADHVSEACVTTDYWLLPDKFQCYPMERIQSK